MVKNLRRLLANHGLSANQRPYHGLHPLAYAARGDKGSHPDKVELLLECGAVVDGIGPHKRTALHYAANAGFDEVVAMLLQAGRLLMTKDDRRVTLRYERAIPARQIY